MRRIHKLALPTLVVCALVALAGDAHAGEPFHPFYQPVVDFFRYFGGWF